MWSGKKRIGHINWIKTIISCYFITCKGSVLDKIKASKRSSSFGRPSRITSKRSNIKGIHKQSFFKIFKCVFNWLTSFANLSKIFKSMFAFQHLDTKLWRHGHKKPRTKNLILLLPVLYSSLTFPMLNFSRFLSLIAPKASLFHAKKLSLFHCKRCFQEEDQETRWTTILIVTNRVCNRI